MDLTKSRNGSFGFTITRSKLDNCYYIQEILDNPAKSDGRLRAGDRLITVRANTHTHSHTHPYISASKTKKQNLCCTDDNFSYVFQVNRHDVTSVADDVAMTILRSTPRRLSMTVGRAVTNLVAPPSCDSLPDVVIYKTPSGQLGM